MKKPPTAQTRLTLDFWRYLLPLKRIRKKIFKFNIYDIIEDMNSGLWTKIKAIIVKRTIHQTFVFESQTNSNKPDNR